MNEKKELTEEVKKNLWEKALKEFPNNRMLQEYFYLRLTQKHLSSSDTPEDEFHFMVTKNTIARLEEKIDINNLKVIKDKIFFTEEIVTILKKLKYTDEEIKLIIKYTQKLKKIIKNKNEANS